MSEARLQYKTSTASTSETGNIHSPSFFGSDRNLNTAISFQVNYNPALTHTTYAIAGSSFMNIQKRETVQDNLRICSSTKRNALPVLTQQITAGAFGRKDSINDTF